MATAPVSRVIVSVHCAAASDTWWVLATLVISGAPRLPMAATTSATNTNVATSTPGRLCPVCARATSRIPWVATLASPSRSSI